MPGILNKRPSGYLECDYENPWPGMVTSLPSSQIPPGACSSCSAMVVRGRLTPQPAIYPVTGTGGLSVVFSGSPPFEDGENLCATAKLQVPGTQQSFTVLITNKAVYADFVVPSSGTSKTFNKLFTFPASYPRYATFGTCVIGNALYFSSASQLGVYALRPIFMVASVEVTNPGGYFNSTPAVVFSDGGGTGATGTASISGGSLTGIALNTTGVYYTPPIVSLNGGVTPPFTWAGNLASAIAVLSIAPSSYTVTEISAFTGVAYCSITSPSGSGYTAPTVVFIGGGGTGASGSAVLATDGSGEILWVNIDSFGQNYTSAPTMKIIDPTGSGASVPVCTLFNGQPFIGGDFAAAISGRLVLGNIIGGDGNNTTTIADLIGLTEGAGYATPPGVDVVGGGGEGASGYTTLNANGQVSGVAVGETIPFTGIITATSATITGVSSVTGIQVGMNLSDNGYGIPSATTVTGITLSGNINLTGNIASVGATQITSASTTTGLLEGQPITGSALAEGTVINSISGSTINLSQGSVSAGSGMVFAVIPGNSISMSNAATESTTENITATGFVYGNQGEAYYGQPSVAITGNSTSTAAAAAQLSPFVQRFSSQTRYPDRLAWSAPNAYGYFDPNFLTAAGGYNTIAEAKGIITGLAVIESVLFVGHNGGETETTPNSGNAEIPFAFYPLWNADQSVVVRYGSMAQYGTTVCFLSNDSAYVLNPSGLTEIGMNIANQLENCSTWNNGSFPLQGLYGSIVVIEGQLHYLIALSSDDYDLYRKNTPRAVSVFDFNMSENSWHQWNYSGVTLTSPIFQSFDTASYPGTNGSTEIARDNWILAGFTVSIGSSAPYVEQMLMYELAPLTRALQLLQTESPEMSSPTLNYQFRSETPSPARMQQERRFLIEYENQPIMAEEADIPTITFTYTGQQDPTSQTGTVSQQQTVTYNFTDLDATVVPGQILTAQIDFGAFTGVATTLGMSASGTDALISIVRITQISDLPKAMVP